MYIEENVVNPIAIEIIAAGMALAVYCSPKINVKGIESEAIINAAGIPIKEIYLVYNFDKFLNSLILFNEFSAAKLGVIAVASAFGAYAQIVDAAIAIV